MTKLFTNCGIKRTTTCRNAQTTTSQTVITVDSQKTTYTYLQFVQKYKKFRHTIKPYLRN